MEQPTPPLSPREKIARLRTRFRKQLPERLTQAHTLLADIAAGRNLPASAIELHRLLHSLKGASRSFGFEEIGEAAARAEHLSTEFVDAQRDPPDTVRVTQFEKHLTELDMVISVFCAGEVDTAPVFALPARQEAGPSGKGGRLIYLCDDDSLLLEQLAGQLTCFGYETATFLTPRTLQEAILARRPDALVMDIHFPAEEKGTDALMALRHKIKTPIPTLFLSGDNEFPARLAAVQAGGDAYVLKPARANEIVNILDEMTSTDQHDPYRILIVDDEPEVAGLHAIILQEAGMVTYHLADPERILDILMEFRPDIVLMDMYMPRCNGSDLARLIRQLPDYIGLPILYLSSETDRKKQFSAMRIGAEGFLTKPVDPDDLIAAVAIRAERMRTLRSLMARDSLTSLFNHTTTTQLLENAIATAKRNGTELCFVMIDIDRFKSVNDTYGHPVGDQVILALSRILQQRLRNSDIVGRYGGEEFAAILQDISPEVAERVVNELRNDFSQIRFYAGTADFSCTFSAGIASMRRHRRMELLREAADRMLYQAKRNGRNRVIVDREEAPSP